MDVNEACLISLAAVEDRNGFDGNDLIETDRVYAEQDTFIGVKARLAQQQEKRSTLLAQQNEEEQASRLVIAELLQEDVREREQLDFYRNKSPSYTAKNGMTWKRMDK